MVSPSRMANWPDDQLEVGSQFDRLEQSSALTDGALEQAHANRTTDLPRTRFRGNFA